MNLKNFKKYKENFGLPFALKLVLNKLFHPKDFVTRNNSIKLKYLRNYLSNLILEARNYEESPYDSSQKNIFVYWNKPLDEAPFVVKTCFSRLKSLFQDYKIILLNDQNLNKYISLNKRILDLKRKGILSIQTFSDILRVNLLNKYGGFWVDSTIFFPKRIELDQQLKNQSFYSLNYVKDNKQKVKPSISKDMTWCAFFLGARKGSPVIRFLVSAFDKYYLDHDFRIDYFLIDFLIQLAKENKIGNGVLDSIPIQNDYPFSLIESIDKEEEIEISQLKIPQKLRFQMPERKLVLLKKDIESI